MHAVIYHNPRCSTSRNALALIREAGIEPEVIEYLRTPPTRERMRHDLDRIGLDDVELERDMARLSGGQAARIALLRALLLEAPLTLLDEVDAALDDASAGMVGALVSAEAHEGRSFLRVRHRAPDGFATRRLRLAEGSLVEVSVADEVADISPNGCACGEGR